MREDNNNVGKEEANQVAEVRSDESQGLEKKPTH